MDERSRQDKIMSDETENNIDKSSLIGVDPLAWLSEEEKASVLNESKSKAANEPYLIKLNSAITIRDITELMAELNSIDPNEMELVFESDQVEKVDAAALQLLSGFYLFAIEAGKKVVWKKPSEALCSAVELLGLKDIINLPSAAA